MSSTWYSHRNRNKQEWEERKTSFPPIFQLHASPPRSFSEKPFHPSERKPTTCHIIYYGMKDRKLIFQFPFIVEPHKKFCAKRFFSLSRTIFKSQANDFPISGERNEMWLKDTWNILQLVTSILWENYHTAWKMKDIFVKSLCMGCSHKVFTPLSKHCKKRLI